MEFIEYGDPTYRQEVSTTSGINDAATNSENYLIGPIRSNQVQKAAPYAQVYNSADINQTATQVPLTQPQQDLRNAQWEIESRGPLPPMPRSMRR
jgi:hypothetical protein